jgi:L-asparaginase II
MEGQMADQPLVEVWRGDIRECVHRGHAVICDGSGQIRQAWGDPAAVVYPRSSSKMLQALPLVESGAADRFGLGSEQLALACASHHGAAYHTDRVGAWLAQLGFVDDDYRCGAHEPSDRLARDGLIVAGAKPCQIHNNCSGKHAGFLTLGRHLGAGPEYIDIDHPVQAAALAAFEEVTGQDSPGWGIDGCSAPNHATTLHGMARAMAQFATAGSRDDVRSRAQVRLTEAMIAHPELVSANGAPCTELMRACGGRVALKGGAEGYYVAIIPGMGLGIALKCSDGAERGSAGTIAALLIRLGLLDPDHPAARRWINGPIRNWRGTEVGSVRAATGLIS